MNTLSNDPPPKGRTFNNRTKIKGSFVNFFFFAVAGSGTCQSPDARQQLRTFKQMKRILRFNGGGSGRGKRGKTNKADCFIWPLKGVGRRVQPLKKNVNT